MKSIEEVRKLYPRKLNVGEISQKLSVSSEQLKAPTLKRFKFNDSDLYHRLLQSFNREEYSSKTVFTCNIHNGITKEWLHKCVTGTGQLNFPVAGMLELASAAATKAVALYGSNVFMTGAIRIECFESLFEVKVKDSMASEPALVSLFVVVCDSGDISILQKFPGGHTTVVCTCRFVQTPLETSTSFVSTSASEPSSSICRSSGEITLSNHIALRELYHVPPLLLREVLTCCGLGEDLSAVESLSVSRDQLAALWRGDSCQYSLKESADGATRCVELRASSGEMVLCMVLADVPQKRVTVVDSITRRPLEMTSRWVSVDMSFSADPASQRQTHCDETFKSILCVTRGSSIEPGSDITRLLTSLYSSVTSVDLREVSQTTLQKEVDAVIVVLSVHDVCFTRSDENNGANNTQLSLSEWLSALLVLSRFSSKIFLVIRDISLNGSDAAVVEALSGSVLSLALEQRHRQFRLALVDLVATPPSFPCEEDHSADRLLEVISSELHGHASGEVETRYSFHTSSNDGNTSSQQPILSRSVRRYYALPPSTLPSFVSEALPVGAYIITGGLGGLGLLTARLLLSKGAQSLVLMSRSGQVSRQGQGLEKLLEEVRGDAERRGVVLQIVRCDVSVEDEVLEMLAAVRASLGPIKGIIHSAGVIRDGLLSTSAQCLQSAEDVWRAKATSASHLHKHTLNDSLSLFVVFSSVVAAVGNTGQVAYAAANRAIEGLVSHRRQCGLCGTAIRWPPVAEVGMAAALLSDGGGDKTQLKSFEVDVACVEDLLGRVLTSNIKEGEEQPAVWTVVPRGMVAHIASLPTASQFAEVMSNVSMESPSVTNAAAPAPVAIAPSVLTVDQISSVVRSAVRSLADCEVDDNSHLMAEGLDSLGVTELSLKVGAALSVKLSPTMVFSHPSINAIIAHVCQLMGITKDPSTVEIAGPVRPLMDSSFSPGTPSSSSLEDVAIVGTAVRFPGSCDSLSDLWTLLVSRQSTSCETPKDRWNVQTALSVKTCDDPAVRERLRCAHFLTPEIMSEGFRPQTFKLTHNEARAMHPCQKLLLHSVHRALQDAGYSTCASTGDDANKPPVPLNTGVFIGAGGFHGSMGIPLSLSSESDSNSGHLGLSAYSATSSSLSVCAGRVSFSLGLTGPCLAIDTACSSSLVALHQARRSLQLGECDLAVVAGVNVLDLESSVAIAVAGMTSADGRCRSFDESACGYGRGEGCGVVILKRLAEANIAGDGIYAVVKGSAVAQDGRSASLTAPNGLAQEALLRTALKDARLDPADISVLEAHGTGTRLGDPIETAALNAVFGADRSITRPLCVSAVKASVGHLEAAAGMAGLFSAILSLQHRRAPPNAQLTVINSRVRDSVDLTRITFPVTPTLLMPRTESAPLTAGVSSFGYSGTIAHVILQEAPNAHPRFDMKEDVCISRFNCPSSEQVTDEDTSEGENDEKEDEEEEEAEGLVWQFSGQGVLQVNAGRDIFDSEESFRGAMLTQCDPILLTHCGLTASELLYPDLTHKHTPQEANSLLQMTRFGQPVLVVLQYCLAEFWRAQDVTPKIVLGHSLGEYAAAIVSGVMSLQDGLRLVCARGRMVQDSPQCGGVMVAVKASETQVVAALSAVSAASVVQNVSLAAVNGPKSCVISGSTIGCAELLQLLPGAANVRLGVVHAFHSPLLQCVVEPFVTVVRSVQMSPPRVTFVSTVRGHVVDEELTTSQYWIDHLLQPVRYSQAVETAYALGGRTFVELGPQNTLTKLTKNILVALGGKEMLAECELVACIENE